MSQAFREGLDHRIDLGQAILQEEIASHAGVVSREESGVTTVAVGEIQLVVVLLHNILLDLARTCSQSTTTDRNRVVLHHLECRLHLDIWPVNHVVIPEEAHLHGLSPFAILAMVVVHLTDFDESIDECISLSDCA